MKIGLSLESMQCTNAIANMWSTSEWELLSIPNATYVFEMQRMLCEREK